jgi:hypothetical protein
MQQETQGSGGTALILTRGERKAVSSERNAVSGEREGKAPARFHSG